MKEETTLQSCYGTLLPALGWSVTTLPWAGLVRKANHMNKIGRVGALLFQGSTFREELCRFQRLRKQPTQPQATSSSHEEVTLTPIDRQRAAGNHPPHSPRKRHNRGRINDVAFAFTEKRWARPF